MNSATYSELGALYVFLLLPICWLAWRKSRKRSATEYYLAGRSLGPVILVLTLFATSFSSSTLMGYPGEAWLRGFGWVISLGMPMGVVLCYHLVAPKMRVLSQQHQFISPGDWIEYRFAGQPLQPVLKVALSIVMVLVSINILFAQFKAMGELTEVLSGHWIPYHYGVLIMAVVILLYDLLGGMRAVAWTDALQACLMLIGQCLMVAWLFEHFSSLKELTNIVLQMRPKSVAAPSFGQCLTWLSTMFLAGLAIIVYPHALQRYFAARSHKATFGAMGFYSLLVLFTHLQVLFIGLGALSVVTDNSVPHDQIMPMLLAQLGQQGTWYQLGAGITILALCAAMMSTADSVLLSTVSIARRDIFRKPDQHDNLQVDWLLAIVIVCLTAGLSLYRGLTLWQLIQLKLEAMLQCFPAFVLCLHNKRMKAKAVLCGLLVGISVYFSVTVGLGVRLWHGIHMGHWALAVNICVCLLMTYGTKKKKTLIQ